MALGRQFRRTERNIGVDPRLIPVELHTLLHDAEYWIGHGTYELDEVAARLHHRMVAIHPFPNGNGRLCAPPTLTTFARSWGSCGAEHKRQGSALNGSA